LENISHTLNLDIVRFLIKRKISDPYSFPNIFINNWAVALIFFIINFSWIFPNTFGLLTALLYPPSFWITFSYCFIFSLIYLNTFGEMDLYFYQELKDQINQKDFLKIAPTLFGSFVLVGFVFLGSLAVLLLYFGILIFAVLLPVLGITWILDKILDVIANYFDIQFSEFKILFVLILIIYSSTILGKKYFSKSVKARRKSLYSLILNSYYKTYEPYSNLTEYNGHLFMQASDSIFSLKPDHPIPTLKKTIQFDSKVHNFVINKHGLYVKTSKNLIFLSHVSNYKERVSFLDKIIFADEDYPEANNIKDFISFNQYYRKNLPHMVIYCNDIFFIYKMKDKIGIYSLPNFKKLKIIYEFAEDYGIVGLQIDENILYEFYDSVNESPVSNLELKKWVINQNEVILEKVTKIENSFHLRLLIDPILSQEDIFLGIGRNLLVFNRQTLELEKEIILESEIGGLETELGYIYVLEKNGKDYAVTRRDLKTLEFQGTVAKHQGEINSILCSTSIFTTGEDGTMQIYDYNEFLNK